MKVDEKDIYIGIEIRSLTNTGIQGESIMETTKIEVFKGKQVRKTIHNNEWYFSIVDIIEALTDSDNPRNYWNMMKAREKQDSEVQLSTFCVQLKMPSADGKSYKTDAVNTQSAFRIIQSIPSPKAEPFIRTCIAEKPVGI